ncbi:hypothetical protein GCM10027280_19520 [Micromonospora polyrhachis]|uniref:Uncharacterized protein n=1 Tax=Micromonospora polyrhachis TaxID=1282883 RepID=A0A7W7WMC8_9ACTN|nr:hypothetical protein [Micromonospora polyrhachis]MBB4957046.1 hypothetical protein [Micromonospora polyrhachis]
MEKIEITTQPALSVDELIAELETQFGDVQMLPKAAYPPPTNGCTNVSSCAC